MKYRSVAWSRGGTGEGEKGEGRDLCKYFPRNAKIFNIVKLTLRVFFSFFPFFSPSLGRGGNWGY